MALILTHPRYSKLIQLVTLATLVLSSTAFAKVESALDVSKLDSGLMRDPFQLLFLLIGIALLPFLAVITTSFAKIIVVLSITRQAIGTAQTPPNIVIVSLAMILTCFSMYPVFTEIYDAIDMNTMSNAKGIKGMEHFVEASKEPMRRYLLRHAQEADRNLFAGIMNKSSSSVVSTEDLIILAPAFLISELTLAFQIGFLIYLPFLVIDMTVANLLMALGMQMLAPTTISLPFKILLFVLVDGWRLLSEGLAKV